jgi:predicted small integral membrane protein
MFRYVKVTLVLAVAVVYSLIVFNGITGYDSNYLFFSHDLVQDVASAGGQGMWTAWDSLFGHTAIYVAMILWQFLTLILCWWGGLRLANALGRADIDFQHAKGMAEFGLMLGLAMWLLALIRVGDEWSAMWQSKTWNGHEGTFAIFALFGFALLVVTRPEVPVRR